ncbi:unnamed protein product [Soboliphyme baturini]|uniref:Secreted protein n=1 Tax=Soboliphyme baturini TaxID=241478 RepID=A0A183IGA5_9BILA|nr:unnamed protein product [Soboliphyme baturini]
MILIEKQSPPLHFVDESKAFYLFLKLFISIVALGSGVTITAVHPGTPVPSNLTREHFLGNVFLRNVILPPVFHLFCRTTTQAAQTSVYCACSEECGCVTGQYFENVRLATPTSAAQDADAAARLWCMSCQMLSIPEEW